MACSMRNIGIFEFISLTNDGRLTFTMKLDLLEQPSIIYRYIQGFYGFQVSNIQIFFMDKMMVDWLIEGSLTYT